MPKQTHKKACELVKGDRINFFRGETTTKKPRERNDSLTDTVKSVLLLEEGLALIETVSGHKLERAQACLFRLAAEEAIDTCSLAAKPRSRTVRGVSIE